MVIFERHRPVETQSKKTATIASYSEQVAQQDTEAYFVTPPGPIKRINIHGASPLNDLEEARIMTGDTQLEGKAYDVRLIVPRYPFRPIQLTARVFRLMTVSVTVRSQPGLRLPSDSLRTMAWLHC